MAEIRCPDSIGALMAALNDKDRLVRKSAARALNKIGTLEILRMLIQSADIDLYEPNNFYLAKSLAVRHFKEEKNEKVDFVPVYPEEIEKNRSASEG